jgi:phosphate uptake regulator
MTAIELLERIASHFDDVCARIFSRIGSA